MAIRISAELSHICPLDEVQEHAAALERAGYFRVWVPDTAVSPWEAWLAAGVVVQNTQRLQVGLGVTNPYTRHPAVVAQMAVTLQRLSRGRLTLSIGKGVGRFLEKAGIVQHESAVEECVTVLRGLIAGERTTFHGETFHVDGLRLRTLPPAGGVPIYLAAIGPAGWQTATRVADGVATIWSDETARMRREFVAGRVLPVAALVPFASTRKDFFAHRVGSVDELEEIVGQMETQGFDEAIVAYADRRDLELAARLVEKRA